MTLFEVGILSKMTENEYEKLGKQLITGESATTTKQILTAGHKIEKVVDNQRKSKPINIKMLQGAFYLIFIGYSFSGNNGFSF